MVSPVITLERQGPVGPSISLHNTGMTEHQTKVFAVFQRVIQESNQQQETILNDIKQIPIYTKQPSEHADKNMILTMMTAFNILKEAQGKGHQEYNQALADVKAGFYYFSQESEDPDKAQKFTATLRGKAPSPAEEARRYTTTIDKKTIGDLFAGVENLKREGPRVTLEQAFDPNAFKALLEKCTGNSAQLTEDDKKAFKTRIDQLVPCVHNQDAKNKLEKLKNTTENDQIVKTLQELDQILSPEEAQAQQQSEAKALFERIYAKILAQIHAQATSS